MTINGSDQFVQTFLLGAGAAAFGAFVGSIVPAWWQTRSATIAALELLATEIESNLMSIGAYVAVLDEAPKDLKGWSVSSLIQLGDQAFAGAHGSTANLHSESRQQVVFAYRLFGRIASSVQRMQATLRDYLAATSAPAYAGNGGGPATLIEALKMTEIQIAVDCRNAMLYGRSALDALQLEREEFANGRLW